MLESVARSYGDRAAGVVLSGAGTDGAVGSLALAQAGGLVLVQDEDGCEFFDMPSTAIKLGATGQGLPLEHLAQALRRWAVSGPLARETPASSTAAAPTNVLLVDDHRILLEGLRTLLEGEADMRVIAVADNGRSAVEMALELKPDVVVMDIRMPKLDGAEATSLIVSSQRKTRIIGLSSEADARSINRIFDAGATGYLTKHEAYSELVQAIRAVMAGGAYLSAQVARLVAAGLVTAPRLSEKGLDVL
jgi:chemotaxis response regulator CheB